MNGVRSILLFLASLPNLVYSCSDWFLSTTDPHLPIIHKCTFPDPIILGLNLLSSSVIFEWGIPISLFSKEMSLYLQDADRRLWHCYLVWGRAHNLIFVAPLPQHRANAIYSMVKGSCDMLKARVRLEKGWIVPIRWSWITEPRKINRGCAIQWEPMGKYQPYPISPLPQTGKKL